jgi:hypothetical protein
MKFTLISEIGNAKITHEFTEHNLRDVLSNIEMFLRGSGFHFDGNLEFVEDHFYDDIFNETGWQFSTVDVKGGDAD